MEISLRTLAKLQVRQFCKVNFKVRLFGDIFGILFFWIIEFVLFFLLKQDGTEIPSIVVPAVVLGCTIPDFICKLILIRDNSVMDAFLKTRPLSQSQWNTFLAISQFWKESNLIMPLLLMPVCFLFIPPLDGIVLFVVLYLASVFGGFIVMALKRRGPYQPENSKSYSGGAIRSENGNFISGISVRSLRRSKRLRTTALYFTIFFYSNCILYSIHDTTNFVTIYFVTFIAISSAWIPQWGFAIESNFFNGIWSRPIPLEKLLASKYRSGMISAAIGGLLCLPFCLWNHAISPLDIISLVLFYGCCSNMFMLIDAYKCGPIDMFGKTFFNYQGSSSNFKASAIIITMSVLAIGGVCVYKLPGWKSQAILSGLGVVSLIFSKWFFKWVVANFMKDRYKYMEKYTSK